LYGRVVHLQPLQWINDWPVIGEIDSTTNSVDRYEKGHPVMKYKKPNVGKSYPVQTPAESDEFNEKVLGLQWQWMANPHSSWYLTIPGRGVLRLNAIKEPDTAKNLWNVSNVLLQKFPAEEFMITVKMNFVPGAKSENEKAGLTIMGLSYASLFLKNNKGNIDLVYAVCKNAEDNERENEEQIAKVNDGKIYLRVEVMKNGKCKFSYSFDEKLFSNIDDGFVAKEGKWTGAKAGIFCTGEKQNENPGYADFDWFRTGPLVK